jgi:signal transduction histidine kinase
VIGALGIFFRRAHPMTSLVISMPGFLLADGLVAPFAALYSLAYAGRRPKVTYIACGVVMIGFTAFWRGEFTSFHHAVFVSTYALVGTIGAVATGLLVRTRRELSSSIEQLRAAQARDIEQIARDVRISERTRLAREMHDVVSHQVSLIAVQAGALQVTADDPDTSRAGSVIRTLAVRTIEELRQMLTILRDPEAPLRELTPQFTVGDIDDLVRESGVNVDLELDVPDHLAPSAQRAIYRTIQEGLANSRKHAPGAPVTIRCRASEKTLLLTLQNGPHEGLVPDIPSTRHGHIGLVERAELLGGTFEADAADGGGYLIRLQIPLN